jgi:hypothetical protein
VCIILVSGAVGAAVQTPVVQRAQIWVASGAAGTSNGATFGLSSGQALASITRDSSLALFSGLWFLPQQSLLSVVREGPDREQRLVTILGSPSRQPTILLSPSVGRSSLDLSVFDATGARFTTLMGLRNAVAEGGGMWRINEPGARQMPPGVYFVRLVMHEHHETHRVIVLR